MKYRHEWKHEISYGDLLVLRQRLSAVTNIDSHATDGKYYVRSLYFDNIWDKALREKIDGVNHREKFRLRYYNGNKANINLEKKSKINGLCLKECAVLTENQVKRLLDGDYEWMVSEKIPLVQEFYSKIMSQGLKPKTIVDYTREPFVYGPGNVRVTLDYDIRTGLGCKDFLNWQSVTVPAGNSPIILEVKWDEYLPDIIRDVVQLSDCRVGAFSKYAACRIYG